MIGIRYWRLSSILGVCRVISLLYLGWLGNYRICVDEFWEGVGLWEYILLTTENYCKEFEI